MLRELLIALAYMPLRLLVLWGGAVLVRHDLREERRRGGPEEGPAQAGDPAECQPRESMTREVWVERTRCRLRRRPSDRKPPVLAPPAALDADEQWVAEMAVTAGEEPRPTCEPDGGPLHFAMRRGGSNICDAKGWGTWHRSVFDESPHRCPKCVEALAIGDDLAVTGNAEGAGAAWRKAGLPS